MSKHMNWRTLSSLCFLFITSACGQSVQLYQASDLPSTTAIRLDSSKITLQGQFLNRVKKIRLLSENIDMALNIQTQSFNQIEAIPSQLLDITLGKTYSFFISSAEADTTDNTLS